jgi:putative heme iron utilization protein
VDRDSAEHPNAARRYLNRHPKAKLYAALADFSFFELAIERASLNGGFGKAYQLTRTDLLSEGPHDELNSIEQATIDRLNGEDRAFLPQIAENSGAKRGNWKVIGLDSEGIDFASETAIHRLNFPNQLEYVNDLRGTLAQLKRSVRS